ncbi:hypothetical protein MP228_006553 [Amoeboaphelidium protococcarum]|nr:hypothetical protein MP228_006553 [Amoeboaphelidium protococcarum]
MKLSVQDDHIAVSGECSSLSIYFQTLKVNVHEQPQQSFDQPSDNCHCFIEGIFGIIQLFTGSYLIVVTKAKSVGVIDDCSILKVSDVHFIPLSHRGASQSVTIINKLKNSKTQSSDMLQDGDGQVDLGYTEMQDAIQTVEQSQASSDYIKKSLNYFLKVGGQFASSIKSYMQMQPTNYAEFNQIDSQTVSSIFSNRIRLSQDELAQTLASNNNNTVNKDAQLLHVLKDRSVIATLRSLLVSGCFFYSSGKFDITNSEQRKLYKRANSQKLFGQLDDRFWWNRHLCSPFLNANDVSHQCSKLVEPFLIPIMQGFVGIVDSQIEGHPFQLALLSRRSRFRSGMRYKRRGIDSDGHVANFVETEQRIRIFESDCDQSIEDVDNATSGVAKQSHLASFVQVRGSIPLFWKQNSTQRKPIPELFGSQEENLDALTSHYDELRRLYGDIVSISLVEQNGREAIVGSQFAEIMTRLANQHLSMIEFDVHQECKKMKYENLSKLVSLIQPFIDRFQYLWKDENKVLASQCGTFRTNCIDCLDRTNLVQSLLGRQMLNQQLLKLGIHSSPEQGLAYFGDFEKSFQILWADNGDAISSAYTSTNALKGDITRTNKRQWTGILQDGSNSVYRLYQNNFRDSFRQNVIDYVQGVISLEQFDGKLQKEQTQADKSTLPDQQSSQPSELRHDMLTTVEQYLISPDDIVMYKKIVQGVSLHAHIPVMSDRGLILTQDSLYLATYDVDLDKVSEAVNIPLASITQLLKGGVSLNRVKNLYGVVILFQQSSQSVQRTNVSSPRPKRPANTQFGKEHLLILIDADDILESQNIAEEVVAKIANQLLRIPDHERSLESSQMDFVLDCELSRYMPATEEQQQQQSIKSPVNFVKQAMSVFKKRQ